MKPTELQTMQAELAALKAENEALKNPVRKERSISFKVSEKGACSVYGLGRFPVSLYKSQWIKLFNGVDDIKAFITAHDTELAEKPVKQDKTATVTNITEGTKAA